LASSQKEENSGQKAYEELKSAKEAEIKAGQAQIDTKSQELADTDEKNAQSKEDSEDTNKSLEADQKFLAMLKDKCSMTDSEWEERQKTRQLEMEAVSKALEVLSGDDAHDLFTKTFNPSLLQTSMESQKRAEASKVLSEAARKLQNPRLATLAVRVRLDAFTRVKKAMDDMIVQLVKEKADEIKHKDFCVDEFNKNEQQTEKKVRAKADVKAKLEDLRQTKKELGEAIDKLKSEIKESQKQLKRAGDDRKKENKEFQMTIADQRATQKLLTAAINILKGFYAKKAALLQSTQPAGFESYKKNAAAGGVMGMIQQIINDAKAMEAEAIHSEEDATKAYAGFVKDTNGSVAAKGKDIVNKSQNKAKTEAALVEAKEDKAAVLLDLEQLRNGNAELHQSCDFVVKNFEIRQTARDEEVDALKQAKAILSGAKFNAFLQSA
jgi:DNA repair exonuclease SbcCD ATPase subunit